MDLELNRVDSLEGIAPSDWNALSDGNPFLRHEFLVALERTGCIGPGTGWEPAYVTARAAGRLVGAMPLYVKHDSRGEFVFDWSWADAYEQTGRRYYPKLVASIPFTPATGRRLLVAPGEPIREIETALLRAAEDVRRELGASSLHGLFPTEAEGEAFAAAGYLPRKSCQFHWRNRGYADFDAFLATFSSEKRKKARRERRRVAEAGIRFEHARGDELSAEDWDAVYDFHARTFLRRGRPPYLNREFFAEVARTMPESLVVIVARYGRMPIAAAICFRGGGALYGRYWGSLADFHSLHFEACYYQGIEYCIREGLDKFEPGTQGEHKISRGFSPTATWSWHRLADPAFRRAVQHFLTRETMQVDAYIDYLEDHVPYRREAR
ncbi:MAG TPA: GNAT family N-acetyltransferase [Gammaproteobacteria bacterium]